MTYTASEMLTRLADWFDAGCKTEIMDKAEAAQMLRQAADAMEGKPKDWAAIREKNEKDFNDGKWWW